jgi:hypothetical protein
MIVVWPTFHRTMHLQKIEKSITCSCLNHKVIRTMATVIKLMFSQQNRYQLCANKKEKIYIFILIFTIAVFISLIFALQQVNSLMFKKTHNPYSGCPININNCTQSDKLLCYYGNTKGCLLESSLLILIIYGIEGLIYVIFKNIKCCFSIKKTYREAMKLKAVNDEIAYQLTNLTDNEQDQQY